MPEQTVPELSVTAGEIEQMAVRYQQSVTALDREISDVERTLERLRRDRHQTAGGFAVLSGLLKAAHGRADDDKVVPFKK